MIFPTAVFLFVLEVLPRKSGGVSSNDAEEAPVPSLPLLTSSYWLVVADHPAEVHMAHEARREAVVLTLERERQLVHLLFEHLRGFGSWGERGRVVLVKMVAAASL